MREPPNPTLPHKPIPPNFRQRDSRLGVPALAYAHNLSVAWARGDDELREAQHLRYRVFAEEMGAQLSGPAGLDVDVFDAYCEHLLVRDLQTLKVVGTYRVLPPHRAEDIGRLYAQGEFDVSRLAHLRPKLVEVGRSCVHAEYRGGAVIMALWAGLAGYMTQHGHETMLGCASVSMGDGGHYAANLYRSLQASSLTAPEYHVFAHTPLPVADLQSGAEVAPPPLLKGYLRLGARICGAPAWDPDFNTADFPTLFRLSDINRRYARRFLGEVEIR